MATQVPVRKFAWQFAWIFLAAIAVVSAAGYLYFDRQQSRYLQATREQLRTIADLKVRQIAGWRRSQLDDAEFIRQSPFLGGPVRAFLAGPAAPEARAQLMTWMSWLQRRFRFTRIVLVDQRQAGRFSLPEGRAELDQQDQQQIREAMRRNEVRFSDLHLEAGRKDIHLDLLVPISTAANPPGARLPQPAAKASTRAGGTGQADALFLLQIEPREYLYSLIQTWPTLTRSETAETLLVRREGDEVLFLNDLRHRQGTALRLRIPITKVDTPSVRAALGDEGEFEGWDYRRVRVEAATRRIPGSPWFLVAKVDWAEVHSPMVADAWRIALVVALCIVATGVGLWLMWSRREAEFVIEERQDRLSALSQMAASLAHEVRNPLTAIKARLFMLGKGLDPGSAEHQDASVISKEIERIDRIVKGYLQFARPAEPRLVRLEAAKPLREIQELLSPQMSQAGIQLEVQPGPPANIQADPEQLKQVLLNLVQNAAEAMGRAGTITLRSYRRTAVFNGAAQPAVVLEVEDTGPGISVEAQGRLFEPFFSTKVGGSGLGLSIASGIVDKHHGRLEYQSEPGRGTTFQIILPSAEGA